MGTCYYIRIDFQFENTKVGVFLVTGTNLAETEGQTLIAVKA